MSASRTISRSGAKFAVFSSILPVKSSSATPTLESSGQQNWIPDFEPLAPRIPSIFLDTLNTIDSRCHEAEGIFRISGANPEVVALAASYNQAIVNNRDNPNRDRVLSQVIQNHPNIHVLASLITCILRDMPEPLLPFCIYDHFLKINDEPDNARPALYRTFLRLLPPGNYEMLVRVLRTLSIVASHAKTNKMTAANLSICFSPLLLRSKEETLAIILRDTDAVTRSIEFMIDRFRDIFEKKSSAKDAPPDLNPSHVSPEIYQSFTAAKLAIKAYIAELLAKASEMTQRQSHRSALSASQVVIEHKRIPTKEDLVAARFQALWRGYRLRGLLRDLDKTTQAQYNLAIFELINRQRKLVQNFNELFQIYLPALKTFASEEAYLAMSCHVERCLHTIISAFDILCTLQNRWPFLDAAGGKILTEFSSTGCLFGINPEFLAHLPATLAILSTCFEAMPNLRKFCMRMQHMSRVDGRPLDQIFTAPLDHLRHERFGVSGPIAKLARITLNSGRLDEAKHWLYLSALNTRICMLYLLFEGSGEDRTIAQAVNTIEFEREEEAFRVALLSIGIGRGRRRLIKSGLVTVASEKRHLLLFNDCFVACKVLKHGQKYQFKYLQWLKGSTLSFAGDPQQLEITLQSPHRRYTFTFKTHQDKMEWISALSATVTSISCLEYSFGADLPWDREFIPPLLSHLIKLAILSLSDEDKPEHTLYHTLSDAFIFPVDSYELQTQRGRIEKAIDIDKINNDNLSLTDIARLILLYLQELPMPLIPWNLVKSRVLFSGKRPLFSEFQQLLSELSPCCRAILHIVIHLFDFAKSGIKLTLLSRVLAPALCWPVVEYRKLGASDDRLNLIQDVFLASYHAQAPLIIETLILYYNKIFAADSPKKSLPPIPQSSSSSASDRPLLPGTSSSSVAKPRISGSLSSRPTKSLPALPNLVKSLSNGAPLEATIDRDTVLPLTDSLTHLSPGRSNRSPLETRKRDSNSSESVSGSPPPSSLTPRSSSSHFNSIDNLENLLNSITALVTALKLQQKSTFIKLAQEINGDLRKLRESAPNPTSSSILEEHIMPAWSSFLQLAKSTLTNCNPDTTTDIDHHRVEFSKILRTYFLELNQTGASSSI